MLILLFLLLLGAVCPGAAGISQLCWYTSEVDNSPQAYGVYVPESRPPTVQGYPAVFHGHGYGWAVSADFSAWQRDWAEANGWVLININARGPNFYGGIGDVAVQEVVRDASARFQLDPDRLYFTGVSMGGTGAYRQGVLRPDVFAAAAPVDGWTDYRLWHWRWYRRKDTEEAIEEFRRPLLESMSPLFWYERGRWGSILALVSGRDTVVAPEEGLRLVEAVQGTHSPERPFDVELFYHETAGHGGANDLARIYEFFRGRRRLLDPPDFVLSSLNLNYGRLYWAEIERFHIHGMAGRLELVSHPDCLEALTRNLDAFRLELSQSPWHDRAEVELRVDGFPAYVGPPQALTLRAMRLPSGELSGWRASPPPQGMLRKRPGLEGPLGDAFMGPFMVVYAAGGEPAEQQRHQREAEGFCRAWNDFNVRAPALQARSETEVTFAELQQRSLVLFGTLESSSLLKAAHDHHPLPVEVHAGEIVVRDPLRGDRRYRGGHFGAFVAYPNPLANFDRYLVVCTGEWATRPDGSVPLGLGYDLEKLPWAYPDYVIFNTDQVQLPWIENVNNKPPVTCYEAAYFVEAGFFDHQWRLDALLALDRLDAQKPPGVLRFYVTEAGLGDADAWVRIGDDVGRPVPQARVTVDLGDRAVSAATDAGGEARFPGAAGDYFRVLNVMATGGVHDWRRDTLAHSVWANAGDLAVRPAQFELVLQSRQTAAVSVQLASVAPEGRRVAVELLAPGGRVSPAQQQIFLQPGDTREATFWWNPHDLPLGRHHLRFQVEAGDHRWLRDLDVELGPAVSPVQVVDLQAQRPYGAPWVEVRARLANGGPRVLRVPVTGFVTGVGVPLEPRRVFLSPGHPTDVVWRVQLPPGQYPAGRYQLRVYVPEYEGSTRTCEVSVPSPG